MARYGQGVYGQAVYGADTPSAPRAVGCLRLVAVLALIAVLLRRLVARR